MTHESEPTENSKLKNSKRANVLRLAETSSTYVAE